MARGREEASACVSNLALKCLSHGGGGTEAVEVYVFGNVIHSRLDAADIVGDVLACEEGRGCGGIAVGRQRAGAQSA